MPCTRFMLLRGGKVVAEGWWYPYNPDSPHRLYSLSKSFTSIAVGLAVEEGLMSLDDLVLDHFPEEAPAEPDENLAAMRVRDLLRMNTGHLKEQADAFWSTERDTWAESFLAVPVGLKPGTHFVYNTGATYMAGLMVQRLTGGTLIDYLTPRLFAPLGIEGATWQSDDEGYNVGGWGLRICTEDIARFGQLLLQRGMWDGRRLLPEWWVAEATALQTADGTYNVRLCFYETPFRPLLTFRFAEDRLLFDMEYNVGFGETKWEELTATAQMGERVER